ncbi:unnamed protein product [Zymoseptoria tritici ST99CH_3D7]|uniref:Secreted protein n=1 Tax=Zymoseptoria tritici (strain ST99CH_3D7) TaxID=1276538 RepID=A0A1X7S185_ZYMT9|nr:unnamed protein product [Zymoseptoria tritici ST99CH_3D7]
MPVYRTIFILNILSIPTPGAPAHPDRHADYSTFARPIFIVRLWPIGLNHYSGHVSLANESLARSKKRNSSTAIAEYRSIVLRVPDNRKAP